MECSTSTFVLKPATSLLFQFSDCLDPFGKYAKLEHEINADPIFKPKFLCLKLYEDCIFSIAGGKYTVVNYCGIDSQLLVVSSDQDTHIKQSDLQNTDRSVAINTVFTMFSRRSSFCVI